MKQFNRLPQKYIDLVEKSDQKTIRDYEDTELKYLLSIGDLAKRTVVDVGAGYGRVLKHLAGVARNVIGVEIDNGMFAFLKELNGMSTNVLLIQGDANQLTDILKNRDVQRPLVVCLQSTLGPWIGDWKIVVGEMQKLAELKSDDVLISVWRQEGLRDYGIDFYKTVAELLGEPDMENTDFEKGIFRTKNGYSSQWFTKKQRADIKKLLGGKVVMEIERPAYWIYHVSYK